MGILRLAHVDVRTPDLDLSAAYYTEVMGLRQVQRTADAVYLKCWDEEDHHSLRMRYHPRTGLDSFTFRVEAGDDLVRRGERQVAVAAISVVGGTSRVLGARKVAVVQSVRRAAATVSAAVRNCG